MCAYDEMGIDTDGTSQRRTLGVKEEPKAGGECSFACFFLIALLIFIVFILSLIHI